MQKKNFGSIKSFEILYKLNLFIYNHWFAVGIPHILYESNLTRNTTTSESPKNEHIKHERIRSPFYQQKYNINVNSPC